MDLDRDLILSCVEEDNIQRAYFRVHPLLTTSGNVHEEAAQMWPTEGCLRIVPDRGEQHTFKERMRSLSGWCVLDLTAFPSDANKIRTNKNFNPDRGEINQYILYSDAVMALPACVFYEVLNGSADDFAVLAKESVTPRFFIRNDDTLFGPVDRAQPIKPDTAPEAEAMLYSISDLNGHAHTILCIASEMDLRPKPTARPAFAKPAAKADPPVKPALINKPEEDSVQTMDAPATEAPANPASESVSAPMADNKPQEVTEEDKLPIGKELKILDSNQSFEDTLSGLNQPVSSSANLLHQSARESMQRYQESAKPSLSGTPLYRSPMHTAVPQPKNKLQEVVASQWRVVRNDPPCDPLPSGCSMQEIDNPVENACTALRTAWVMPAAQTQLFNCILSLEGMAARLESRAARQHSAASPLQQAIQSRLQDLEAERLSVLVQLDKAKEDLDAYRASAIASATDEAKNKLTQLEKLLATQQEAALRLKEEINLLTAQRDELSRQIDAMSGNEIPARILELLSNSAMTIPLNGTPLRMSPLSGNETSLDELIGRIETLYKQCDLPFTRNHAIALLIVLAVSNRVGLVASAQAAAATLIRNLCACMGWSSSFAQQVTAEQRPVVAAAPADATPAVLLTMLASYAPLAGIQKLMLARTAALLTRNAAYDTEQWPIFPLNVNQFVPEVSFPNAKPVAAASLKALLKPETALDEQIDKVLSPILAQIPALSGRTKIELRQFISSCAPLMDGGLAAACDWAILLWVIPCVDRNPRMVAALKPLLVEYPLSLEALA